MVKNLNSWEICFFIRFR